MLSRAVPASGQDTPLHEVDLSVGGLAAFNGDHRDAYGVATAVTVGYSPRLGRGSARLILDLGFIRGSGDEFASDPTFRTGKAEYSLFPIDLGVRANVVPSNSGGPVAMYVGTALTWMPTRWSAPFVGSATTPMLGVLFELRPEVTLSDRWGVWARSRLRILSESDYRNRIPIINYSGNVLEFGVSYRPR